ncbi:hypothetical protein EAG11_12930 [Flavobacterium sp. 140616W15]|nr:hypothetical protein EAG11_12930 [Flavobacterium sp. 140616W15]
MYSFLVNLGYFLLLINFIVFAFGLSKKQKSYVIFTVYLFLIVCIQIITLVLRKLGLNNLFLSHFYFIGQFIMLGLFYFNLITDKFQKKVIKITVILALLSLAIQYSIRPDLFFKFNLYEIFITSFLLLIFATFHFYNMLNGKKMFYYINIGIILYLFGSTILFLVGNLSVTLSSKYYKVPSRINYILYVIFQLFILVEWKRSFYKKDEANFLN